MSLYTKKVSIGNLTKHLKNFLQNILTKISCIKTSCSGQIIIEFFVILLFCISLISLSTMASKKYKITFKNNETLKSR